MPVDSLNKRDQVAHVQIDAERELADVDPVCTLVADDGLRLRDRGMQDFLFDHQVRFRRRHVEQLTQDRRQDVDQPVDRQVGAQRAHHDRQQARRFLARDDFHGHRPAVGIEQRAEMPAAWLQHRPRQMDGDVLDRLAAATAAVDLVGPHDARLADADVERLLQAVELAGSRAHPDDLERVVQVRRVRVLVTVGVDDLETGHAIGTPDPELDARRFAARYREFRLPQIGAEQRGRRRCLERAHVQPIIDRGLVVL